MGETSFAFPSSETWLFVYGTLKSGMSNHRRLRGQRLIRAARTEPRYRLLRIRWYPGLIEVKEGGQRIEGEIYAVDPFTLKQLDEYEGVPILFDRRPIAIENESHPIEAYFYCGDVTNCPDLGVRWVES
jgi:gamma-glutamylcyclotransferase (GGCT)/AIG2-like uncharacterized protein YtfP